MLLLFMRLVDGPIAGPGRVAYAGLQQSIPTREPNFEPRKETMCLLQDISMTRAIVPRGERTECVKPPPRDADYWHGSRCIESSSSHTDRSQLRYTSAQ